MWFKLSPNSSALLILASSGSLAFETKKKPLIYLEMPGIETVVFCMQSKYSTLRYSPGHETNWSSRLRLIGGVLCYPPTCPHCSSFSFLNLYWKRKMGTMRKRGGWMATSVGSERCTALYFHLSHSFTKQFVFEWMGTWHKWRYIKWTPILLEQCPLLLCPLYNPKGEIH